MKRSIVFALLIALVFVLSLSNAVEAGTLYASDDSADNIYTINTATGAASLVGPTGINISSSGLAYDTSSNTMYVSDVFVTGGPGGLGTVNLLTGAVTFIGSHLISINIHGLTYDSVNNVLYGSDLENGCGLVTVDRATGAATFVGIFSGAACLQIRGLAYVPGSDTLYGVDESNLYTINRTTGAAALVGPHTIVSVGIIGLAFDNDTGIMYAAETENNDLYTVNTATGASTVIGPTGIDVSGLAVVPNALMITATEVPTMNQWGMIIFMLLAGVGAIYYLRGKRIES